MVQFYCPSCWGEVAEASGKCPLCGVDIETFWNRRDYGEKLIQALRHPEPQTPVRAAWLLGQLRDPRAVEPLIEIVLTTKDIYLARAAVEALGKVGSHEAEEFLSTLVRHPTRMIAEEARIALRNIERMT